jgi:hypothetical protein
VLIEPSDDFSTNKHSIAFERGFSFLAERGHTVEQGRVHETPGRIHQKLGPGILSRSKDIVPGREEFKDRPRGPDTCRHPEGVTGKGRPAVGFIFVREDRNESIRD